MGEEEHATILPSDRDPIKLDEIMKDQKKGVEWIKQRTDQLFKNWQDRFDLAHMDLEPEDLKTIAREWADLENDFNYLKEINTFMATRYEEVFDCLPSLPEIDELIQSVEWRDPNTDAYFCTAPKDQRLAKLKKLRSAIAHSMGNK